jgi:8-oxo-dGTP pyrophosphatase MutT (NUDIX family)
MIVHKKAFAYITHRRRLLVFEHIDHPEAGIQVPAGTIAPGETPESAVLREAYEETGLAGLALVGLLGELQRDMADFGRDEIHHRYFFHLICGEEPPESWLHEERHASRDPTPIRFQLYWVTLPPAQPLIAGHGDMLEMLMRNLKDSIL